MSEDKILFHKLSNFSRSAILMLGMLVLMLTLGYALFGAPGLIWAGILGAVGLVGSSGVPAHAIIRMQGGKRFSIYEAPDLLRLLRQLSQRAGLPQVPQLYVLPGNGLNAFAAGRRNDPAIAVTQGLLRTLNLRELSAVLAHEISHIRNKDLQLQLTVSIIARLTRFFSLAGQFLFFLYLPMALMGQPPFSWPAMLLLIATPALMAYMANAFSRTREMEADLEAARLTGDPGALALALQKLDYYNGGGLLGLFRTNRGGRIPNWLRTHPTTKERVERLRSLVNRMA